MKRIEILAEKLGYTGMHVSRQVCLQYMLSGEQVKRDTDPPAE